MTNAKSSPRQSLVSRLLLAIGASALGPIVTAAIQLGSVPLLLHIWGASKYGDWLLISAIPTYFTLTDLGFGTSSGSDMTMRVAAGDRKGALTTFQSSWVLLSCVSLAVFAFCAVSVWWLPWQHILHLGGITSKEAARIMLILTAWILTVQQWSLLESGYRCDGNFALGNFCSTVQRLLEAVAANAVGVITGSFLLVAVAYLGSRLMGLICYGWLLKRISSWLSLGFQQARMDTIRRMLKPSIGFVAMPLGNAVSLQGFMMVVGVVLGPAAVTAFSTARTMTRVGLLMINPIATGMWPELSSAFGSGNLAVVRKLRRHAYQASLILAGGCAIFLWVAGPQLYQWWVKKVVPLDLSCFHILLLVTIANSLWYVSAVVQMSANRHSRLAFVYLTAALGSCALGYFLTGWLGLVGSAVSLLLIEMVMCGYVLCVVPNEIQGTPAIVSEARTAPLPNLSCGWGIKRH